MDSVLKDQFRQSELRPTGEVEDFERVLREHLGMQHKYQSARLSIGRSLAEQDPPPPLKEGEVRGKGINAEQLFGEELDLWLCLLRMEFGGDVHPTFEELRRRCEAHWARGARLLKEEFEGSKDILAFLRRLAALLPERYEAGMEEGGSRSVGPAEQDGRPVIVNVGRSVTRQANVEFELNGPGASPHVAIMGRVGTGKTRTGIRLLTSIVAQAQCAFLVVDPKGEFIQNGKISPPYADTFRNARCVTVGKEPIPLDVVPRFVEGRSDSQFARELAAFRDCVLRCCGHAGDVQKDRLYRVLDRVCRQCGAQGLGLEEVENAYRDELTRENKEVDSVLNRLSEMCRQRIFEPRLRPEDFVVESWVLSFVDMPDESKRLTMLLVIDVVKRVLLGMPDSSVKNGYRTLRHVLWIDEARRVLQDAKQSALSDLVRLGRSKGSCVMMLSQDPGDFSGMADDFLSQIGAVISFACSHSDKGLRELGSIFGRKLMPAEFSDTHLKTGVAFVKVPSRDADRVECWSRD